ncbi:hypothetical protein E9993_15280 [Labilibacter sediminis]|nr:hypothetical protein E9993_15280 [Labilibacter sediminis]
MIKRNLTSINIVFGLILFSSLTVSCFNLNKTKDSKKENSNQETQIEGMWELHTYQPQDDTAFIVMEGVTIKKVFCDKEWMSIAISTKNNKVVHTAGGNFSFYGNSLSEEVLYHQKNLESIGDINTFNVTKLNDTLYVSGILNPDTEDEYKIEEYWVKVSK